MLNALLLLIRWDFRGRYSTPWALGGELLGTLLSLWIYWYMAKAFVPALPAAGLASVGSDYFSFLLLGEAVLLIPLYLLHGLPHSLRQAAEQGTLHQLLVRPLPIQVSSLLLAASALPREAIRAGLTLFLAWLLFSFQLGFPQAMGLFVIQLMALPAFLGLGLLASALVLTFGRGSHVLHYAGSVAAVLAGAYFPIEVLPKAVQGASSSPFGVVVQGSREILAGGTSPLLAACGKLALWGVVLGVAGYAALGLSAYRLRAKGTGPWAR